MKPSSVQSFDDLKAENQRLKAVQPVGQKATLFIVSIVVLCVLTVAAIVLITIIRPEKDNTQVIATIIGISAPVSITLLGAAVQQVHLAVNSRLSQLLELTATSSKARGALQEKERNGPVE